MSVKWTVNMNFKNYPRIDACYGLKTGAVLSKSGNRRVATGIIQDLQCYSRIHGPIKATLPKSYY